MKLVDGGEGPQSKEGALAVKMESASIPTNVAEGKEISFIPPSAAEEMETASIPASVAVDVQIPSTLTSAAVNVENVEKVEKEDVLKECA